MSIRGVAHIAGIFEHPTRHAKDKSVAQLHGEVAAGALADAGLTLDDVDGYFCAGDAPGLGPLSMIEYMGLRNVRHMNATDVGGSSYVLHIGHAAQAIALGKCSVALITLAGRPRAEGMAQLVRHQPGGLVTQLQLPRQKQGRNPAFVAPHPPRRQKPFTQGCAGAVKYRAGGHRMLLAAARAFEHPGTALKLIAPRSAAAGADITIRPAPLGQGLNTGCL